MAFSEQLHPRGTGAQGGQFVVKGSGGKTSKQSALSFDGKRGSGYGVKGGDGNVKALQAELNRLGILDSRGQQLKLDGKLGPKTTAAIRRLQRKLGLPPDGRVTPAFLAKIRKLKPTAHESHVMHVRHVRAIGGKVKTAPTHHRLPAKKATPARKTPPRKVSYSRGMTDVKRHLPGQHNQGSHGNRLGRPENIGGKTGLAKATSALADKPELGPERAPATPDATPRRNRPEYRKAYERGWRGSKNNNGGNGLERGDDRGESDAWYDGWEDYAIGKEKWFSADEQDAEDRKRDTPAPGKANSGAGRRVGTHEIRYGDAVTVSQDDGSHNIKHHPRIGSTGRVTGLTEGGTHADVQFPDGSTERFSKTNLSVHQSVDELDASDRKADDARLSEQRKSTDALRKERPAPAPARRELSAAQIQDILKNDSAWYMGNSRRNEEHLRILKEAGVGDEQAREILKDLGGDPDKGWQTTDIGRALHHAAESEKLSAAEAERLNRLKVATPTAFARLLGTDGREAMVKSRAFLPVFEAMQASGWTLTSASGHGGYTFSSPDGERSINILTINGVTVYDKRHNKISGVKALAYVKGSP